MGGASARSRRSRRSRRSLRSLRSSPAAAMRRAWVSFFAEAWYLFAFWAILFEGSVCSLLKGSHQVEGFLIQGGTLLILYCNYLFCFFWGERFYKRTPPEQWGCSFLGKEKPRQSHFSKGVALACYTCQLSDQSGPYTSGSRFETCDKFPGDSKQVILTDQT